MKTRKLFAFLDEYAKEEEDIWQVMFDVLCWLVNVCDENDYYDEKEFLSIMRIFEDINKRKKQKELNISSPQ